MSIVGGDVESISSSLPNSTAGSAPGTPRNRLKFMCSHGGKILPRPADAQLKYVGGETRVISVPHDITVHELMKKLTNLINGEMILKYQIMPEDLDALVTVKSDEDLCHMIEECDLHDLLGAPRLRAFLFPVNPIVMHQTGPMDHHSLEQRYINSINGILVHPSPIYSTTRPPPINTSDTTFSFSSACSSPRTSPGAATNSATASSVNLEITNLSSPPTINNFPCMCNLCCNSPRNHQHHLHQPPQSHHVHPHLQQSSARSPLERHPHKNNGPMNIGRTRSPGVMDHYRYQTDYPRSNRGGHVFYQMGLPYDEYYRNCRYDRTESPPGSPLAPSPGVLSRSPSIMSGPS